jgi:hypothetical protein
MEVVDFPKRTIRRILDKSGFEVRNRNTRWSVLKSTLLFDCALTSIRRMSVQIFSQGIAGGNGANHFDDQFSIQDGMRIRSIHVHHGNSIDQLLVVYELPGGGTVTMKHGGNGGVETDHLDLVPGEYLTYLGATFGNYVDSLQLATSGVRTQVKEFGNKRFIKDSKGNITNGAEYRAPAGFQIIAFWGNEGNFVDAIGVHYSKHP